MYTHLLFVQRACLNVWFDQILVNAFIIRYTTGQQQSIPKISTLFLRIISESKSTKRIVWMLESLHHIWQSLEVFANSKHNHITNSVSQFPWIPIECNYNGILSPLCERMQVQRCQSIEFGNILSSSNKLIAPYQIPLLRWIVSKHTTVNKLHRNHHSVEWQIEVLKRMPMDWKFPSFLYIVSPEAIELLLFILELNTFSQWENSRRFFLMLSKRKITAEKFK